MEIAKVYINEIYAEAVYDELLAKYGINFSEYVKAMEYVWETENAPAGGMLPDYIDHPTLFDHYPELNRVAVRFEPLGGNTWGQYRPDTNTIVINERVAQQMEDGDMSDTFLHEIQHVIQEIEGFARGSNPEFWKEFQAGATPIMTGDGRIRRLEERIDEILAELPENVAAQFEWYRELDKAQDPRVPALIDELGDGMYGDQFEEYFDAIWDLEMERRVNRPRSALNLYRNTAGEIEARDAAARRSMTEEQRKNTPPDLGGEETVFMEGRTDTGWTSAEYDPETASIKEQLENSAQRLSEMPVAARTTVPTNLSSKSQATKWATALLKPTGYQVDRQGFGVIRFDEEDIRYGLNYADTAEEKAAIAVLPQVLKRGVEIGRHGNHKLREKETVTFAAPVEINGTRANVGVVVVVRGGRYYTHRVVMPDGSAFKFGQAAKKDATQETLRGVPTDGSLAKATSVTSINTVPNAGQNVKQYSVGRSRELSQTENEAVRIFGTTKSFAEAGYLMPDGSMLRFTDDQHGGRREYDHRAIAMAYGEEVDLSQNHGFSFNGGQYLNDFVEAGNIRFDCGEPELGMDIGLQLSAKTPLTKAQERLIRDLVEWKQDREGEFEAHMTEDDFLYTGPLAIRIDFGGDAGYAVGSVSTRDLTAWSKKSLEYKGRNISAQQIIHDIRRYYETGETTQRSSLAQFRYSISGTDSQGRELTPEQQEFFHNSRISDAQGRLMVMYHGTMHGGFTEFGGKKDYWYFTNDRKYAYTFEGRKGNGHLYPSTKEGIEAGYYSPQRYKVYLNVTNPFVTNDVDVVEDALYWDRTLAGRLREQG